MGTLWRGTDLGNSSFLWARLDDYLCASPSSKLVKPAWFRSELSTTLCCNGEGRGGKEEGHCTFLEGRRGFVEGADCLRADCLLSPSRSGSVTTSTAASTTWRET